MSLIPFLKNDKKNNDKDKFYFIKKHRVNNKTRFVQISLKKLNYYFSAIAQ